MSVNLNNKTCSVKTKKSLHCDLTPNQISLKTHIEKNPEFLKNFNAFLPTIIPMIHTLAKQYGGNNRELCEDLYQEGVIGAMIGFQKFNPNKGTKPSSFCYFWIRQQIQTFLYQKGSMITVSHYCRVKIKKAKKEWYHLAPQQKQEILNHEAKMRTVSLDSPQLASKCKFVAF